jgi:hypothetical protein
LYLLGRAQAGFPCRRVYHDFDVLPVLWLARLGFFRCFTLAPESAFRSIDL